jgi:hypothetical protein
MPPEGGGGGDIPLGAEKRMWHHDRALLISSWYGVPPVRRSPRCAWGWGVAWDAGLPHKTLLQPPNAGTAEPFRVSPPEAVAYPLELSANPIDPHGTSVAGSTSTAAAGPSALGVVSWSTGGLDSTPNHS